MERTFTISIFTENSPGVLHRITVIFTRRKMNIESLTVCETEKHGISRFTITVTTTEDNLIKVVKQIQRIIEVVDVFSAENKALVFREVALIKVATETPEQRKEIEEIAVRHTAVLTHVHNQYVIVQKTGTEDDISSLQVLLEPFGIIEFIRSGRVALLKNEKPIDRLLIS